MKIAILMAGLSLSMALVTTPAVGADDWVPLSNGQNLTGWVQKGGKAKYLVEDGVIVGMAVTNTGNSFLCTEKAYGDFVLEYEFKVDPRLNSGVQIRSHCLPEASSMTWQGKTLKVPAGRVHGPQIEIDNDPVKKRWWTAGIYEEGRRGWLYPGARGGDEKEFTKQGGKLTRPTDWNQVRVVAKGDKIETFLNGESRASITDGDTTPGFIALQVHGIGSNKELAGAKVMWRNLRIQPLTPPENWNTTAPAEK